MVLLQQSANTVILSYQKYHFIDLIRPLSDLDCPEICSFSYYRKILPGGGSNSITLMEQREHASLSAAGSVFLALPWSS
jgi:hypothetical protein